MADGELHALVGLYLREQLPSLLTATATSATDFDAAGRKHADSIVLQDITGYGDDTLDTAATSAATTGPIDFRECRTHRGSAEFWRHNENAAQLPGLVAFVDRALSPILSSTGKVTVLLSKAGDEGVEHVDHKFADWVSEFVWLRTGVGATKEFYVRDADGRKCYAAGNRNNECCIWFDDHHSHSFDTIAEASYSIRVDGCFTEHFRAHLCKVGTFWKNRDSNGSGALLRDVLQSQHGEPLSVAATQSQTTAIASAHAACVDERNTADLATTLRNELRVAHREIARLEKVVEDKKTEATHVLSSPVDSFLSPLDAGPPLGLTEGSLFSRRWIEATRPLYELQMGTENMGPLLYSIIRFHKPVKVLEVDAGFTTLFALQALQDNDVEIAMYQQLYRDQSFVWPKLNWLNEGYLQRSGGYRHSELYCVDNMAHTGTTARLVSTVAANLGLEERLVFFEGDATCNETRDELLDDLGGSGRVGLLWIDFR